MMNRGKFGKTILLIELIACLLVTFGGFALAYLCIIKGYTGSLPWIGLCVSPTWAAYGASKVTYNNKTCQESLPYCQAEADLMINRDA